MRFLVVAFLCLLSGPVWAQGRCDLVFLDAGSRSAMIDRLKNFEGVRHLDLRRRIVQNLGMDWEFFFSERTKDRPRRLAEFLKTQADPQISPEEKAQARKAYWVELATFIQRIHSHEYQVRGRPESWPALWARWPDSTADYVARKLSELDFWPRSKPYNWDARITRSRTRAMIETVSDALMNPDVADEALVKTLEGFSAKHAERFRRATKAKDEWYEENRDRDEIKTDLKFWIFTWQEWRSKRNFKKLLNQSRKIRDSFPQRAAEEAFEAEWERWRKDLLAEKPDPVRPDPVALSRRLDRVASVVFLFRRLELPNGLRYQDVLSGRVHIDLETRQDLETSLQRRRQQLEFIRHELSWLEGDVKTAMGNAAPGAPESAPLAGFESAIGMLRDLADSVDVYVEHFGMAAEQGEAVIRKLAAALKPKSLSERVWDRVRGSSR